MNFNMHSLNIFLLYYEFPFRKFFGNTYETNSSKKFPIYSFYELHSSNSSLNATFLNNGLLAKSSNSYFRCFQLFGKGAFFDR